MNTNNREKDYLKALGKLFYKMKGIKYWELIGDMSAGEMVFLNTLSGAGKDSMQVGELTEKLAMHPTAVSRLMNSLEKKGYIERTLHKGNRRITDVSMTQQGKEKQNENTRIMNNYWETVLSEMGGEDLRALLRVSEELIDRMEEIYQEQKNASKV